MSSSDEDNPVIRKASSLTVGSSFRIGKYVLGERIGSGGFGIVRKAINEETTEVVAIKVLDKSELKLHDMTLNVKKEIALLTTLHHPNIVAGLEVLNSKTKILMVMEYVGGGDMHTALSRRKKFKEPEAKRLFRSLIDCLAYCHKRGVYHRDLKLENLLLTNSGDLKVCDFGLASVRSMTVGKNDLCKTIVGTEDFSPPEIVKQMPYKGDKADMWSAAIVLYVMLAGFCPFRGRSPRELAQNILSCKYSFPAEFPEGPKRIIRQLLVPNGKKRPSAVDVSKEDWLCGESPRSISEKDFIKVSQGSPQKKPSKHTSNLSNYNSGANLGKKPYSLRSSKDSPLSEVRRTASRQVSLNLVGSRKSAPIRYEHGHPVYNAIARANIPDFLELLRAMRDPVFGVVVQDRRWRLRTFPKCFIGSEAVSWLSEQLSISRQSAVEMGQHLIDAGVFHHVVRDHDFEDQYLFYRWHSDDPTNVWVANLRTSYQRPMIPRPAQLVVYDLLNELLTLCKAHQQFHDFRKVDTKQMQRDTRLHKFVMSAGELQHATLPVGSNEQKLSFLVNIHNLMWLQARVHIGEFEEIDNDALHRLAKRFEYAVQGIRVSLEDIDISLQTSMMASSFIYGEKDHPRRRSGVSFQKLAAFQNTPLKRLLGLSNNIESEIELREALRPTKTDPLVLFLMSDGSPDSPQIQAVSEKFFTTKYLNKVAQNYLNNVISIDENSLAVRYPPRVEEYRKIVRMFDDKEFLFLICGICNNSPIGDQLRSLLKRGNEQGVSPTAHRVNLVEVDTLGAMFAPHLPDVDAKSNSIESSTDDSLGL